MSLLRRWLAIEQYVFHPELRKNTIRLRQARLMFAVLVVSGVTISILILAASYFSPHAPLRHYLILVGHLATCSTAISLRYSPTMKRPAQLLALVSSLHLFVCAWITGGVHSSTLYFYPVVSVFFGIIGTHKETIFVTVMLCLVITSIWYIDGQGISLQGDATTTPIKMVTLILCCLIGGGMALFMGLQIRVFLDRLHIELTERKVAQRRAERANQTKNLYMAFLSHEIRNPLQVILAHVEFLDEDGLTSEERGESIESIKQASRGLSDMLHDVLTFTSLERSQILIRQEHVDLAPLFQEMSAIHRESARRKELELFIESIPSTRVHGDIQRLRQVLNNLLSNAIKYTPSGAVSLHAERDGDKLLIHVVDTGPGISEELQTTIFQPFERAEDAKADGTGIGLAVCQGLVTRMGGQLRLVNIPDGGCDFSFDLQLISTKEVA